MPRLTTILRRIRFVMRDPTTNRLQEELDRLRAERQASLVLAQRGLDRH